MSPKDQQTALFAGGCFWCIQEAFDKEPGVLSTTVGYTGGTVKSPTYEQVCSGITGHVEAILVCYDPEKVTYEKLLEVFWHNIDPTRSDGQFCDIGSQYRPVIFYKDDMQKEEAERSIQQIIESKPSLPVKVTIAKASSFYPAEKYHQKYYEKSAIRYQLYHHGSGRGRRLNELWGEEPRQ